MYMREYALYLGTRVHRKYLHLHDCTMGDCRNGVREDTYYNIINYYINTVTHTCIMPYFANYIPFNYSTIYNLNMHIVYYR